MKWAPATLWNQRSQSKLSGQMVSVSHHFPSVLCTIFLFVFTYSSSNIVCVSSQYFCFHYYKDFVLVLIKISFFFTCSLYCIKTTSIQCFLRNYIINSFNKSYWISKWALWFILMKELWIDRISLGNFGHGYPIMGGTQKGTKDWRWG